MFFIEAVFFKYALISPIMHKLEIKSVKAITNCFNVSTKATVYAHTYYKKLVKVYKSQKDYTDYEKEISRQVEDFINMFFDEYSSHKWKFCA